MQSLIGRITEIGELIVINRFVKRELIVQVADDHNICFTVIGDKTLPDNLLDALVEVDYMPESKQWNGKWYTSLNVHQIRFK